MYTEQDYQDIRAQLRRRMAALFIPCALLLVGVIVSFIYRMKPLTIGLSILLGAVLIFGISMLIFPVYAYKRHLDNVLHGRVRTLSGAFKSVESEIVLRDGVRFRPFLVTVGNMDDPEDDRLFYYDANLPFPDWNPGDSLTLTSHDKAVGAWKR